MRTTTLTRALRVALTLAGLAALPQFASAQLPIETKEVKIQAGGTSTNAVTLSAPTVTSSYGLKFPAAQGTNGGFLYMKTASDGQLAFASTANIQNGSTPVWNSTAGEIMWEDPNGANNPNWSRAGNAISSTGKLGATTGQGFNIVTNDLVRMGFSSDGNITINTVTDGTTTIGSYTGNDVNIGNSTGDIAVTGGLTVNNNENRDVAINGGTSTGSVNIGSGASAQTIAVGNGAGVKTVTLGSTNTTSVTTINGGSGTGGAVNITADTIVSAAGLVHTGTVNLAGANSDLKMAGDAGASGEVLVSKGVGATPEWQNLTESIGIKEAGNVDVSGANSTSAITVGGDLESTDAILITLQTASGSAVVATVTARDNGANTFVVSFSGTFTGTVNYLVIKTL